MRLATRTILLCALAMLSLPYAARAQSYSVDITATVPGCGDGIIGQGEQCEGANLGGASCASLGYVSGTLKCSVACTYDTSSCERPSSGGGGGGSMSSAAVSANTSVVVTGVAYPNAPVELLKDGQLVATVAADEKGKFQLSTAGLGKGEFQFAVHASDAKADAPTLVTVPIDVIPGATTKVDGVYVPPSVEATPKEIHDDEDLVVAGRSAPNAKVEVTLDGDNARSVTANADASGNYRTSVAMGSYEAGEHYILVRAMIGEVTTIYSHMVPILVLGKAVEQVAPIASRTGGSCERADVNCDGRIDLSDLSVMLYWYGKFPVPPKVDLDGDGVLSIRDFSILMYFWTG